MEAILNLFTAFVFLFVISSAYAGQYSWSMYKKNSRHTGYVNTDLDFKGAKLRWQKDLSKKLNPVIADNLAVYATSTRSVYALSLKDGDIIWSKTFVAGIDNANQQPAMDSNNIYFQDGGYLRAYHRSDGSLVFKASYSTQWSTYLGPTVIGNMVATPCGYTNGVCVYNSVNGNTIWSTSLSFFDTWTPTLTNDYVLTLTDVLHVFDRKTGKQVFTFGTSYPYSSLWEQNGAAIVGDMQDVIYDHADDGLGRTKDTLYSISLTTHHKNWKTSGQFLGQPVVGDGVIYINTTSGIIQAYAEANGQLLWSWENKQGSAVYGDLLLTHNVLLIGSASTTYAVDLNTHKTIWSTAIGGKLALVGNSLLIANSFGKLSVITVKSSNPNPAIDVMTTGYSYIHYSPYYGELDIFSYVNKYFLNDGTSWDSGAGQANGRQMKYAKVFTDLDGNLHYMFTAEKDNIIFYNIDYDSGDHSAQGSLSAYSNLELVAKRGSKSAIMLGFAKVFSNDQTAYGIPRFNYYSAKVGSLVPYKVTVTLNSGVFTKDTFTHSFDYELSGKIDFSAKAFQSAPFIQLIGKKPNTPQN